MSLVSSSEYLNLYLVKTVNLHSEFVSKFSFFFFFLAYGFERSVIALRNKGILSFSNAIAKYHIHWWHYLNCYSLFEVSEMIIIL